MSGSFRVDRDGVEAWLAAAFPRARARAYEPGPRKGVCPARGPGYGPEGGSRCLGVDHATAVPGRARRVEIGVEPDPGGGGVLVRFLAFDV